MVQLNEQILPARLSALGMIRHADSNPYANPLNGVLLGIGAQHDREDREKAEVDADVNAFFNKKASLKADYLSKLQRGGNIWLEPVFQSPERSVLKWKERLSTLDRVDDLFAFFTNNEIGEIAQNPDLQKEVQRRFQGIIDSSPTFEALHSTKGITKGNTVSPEHHMLHQMELAWKQIEGIPESHHDLFIHMCFWHDFGKVTDARHPMHGVGSALMARSYYERKNAIAKLQNQKEPYSPAFIDDLTFLLENHHFFQDLHQLITPEAAEMIRRADPALRHQENTTKDQILQSHNRRYVYKQFISKAKAVICTERFKRVYPMLMHRPDLLYLLQRFSTADLLTNKTYATNYLQENIGLFDQVMKIIALPDEIEAQGFRPIKKVEIGNSFFKKEDRRGELVRTRVSH